MQTLLESIRWVHIIAGFTALTAFWIPVFAHKGGKHHRFYGKVFKYAAYVTQSGAMVVVVLRIMMGLTEGKSPGSLAPQLFVSYLALGSFISLRHGIQVLEHKHDIEEMNNTVNRVVAYLAIASSAALIAYTLCFSPPGQLIYFAFAPGGLAMGVAILITISGKRPERKVWFYEHMAYMLLTGIGFHTAFAVFGSNRIFDLMFGVHLPGYWVIVPLVLPSLVGVPAVVIWTRFYQSKFRDVPTWSDFVERLGRRRTE